MKRKRLLVIFSTIIIALAIFIYTKQDNDTDNSINKDGYVTEAEYGTMVGNTIENNGELPGIEDTTIDADSIGDGSGTYGEVQPKLDKIYEDAMENSDLFPFEKEIIRMIVDKENKSFEEALQSVRPGAYVIEERTEVPSNTDIKSTKPIKQEPAPKEKEPSGNSSDSADFNNGDNRTQEQKEADNNDPYSSGISGPSGNVDHEPDW